MTSTSSLKIDVHVHLAGTGCCNSGCWISPGFRRRYTFVLLKALQGISRHQMNSSIDKDWAAKISRLVGESELDYATVLGFDGVYGHSDGSFDRSHSQMVVPQDWVFQVCEEHPHLLPAPSINPHREDALPQLERAVERGAVLIKWLPATQGIDPASPRIRDFLKLAAESRIPLLIHMGGERTFAEVASEMNDVEKLRGPLDAGVPVICAHTATRILGSREPDQIPKLRQLLKEYPHLWVDNSGLCNPARWSHVPRLATDAAIANRTLYGSDWPVPSNAFYYPKTLGVKRCFDLERIRNPFDRDIAIKRACGYPEDTLTRPNKVLANLDRWVAKP